MSTKWTESFRFGPREVGINGFHQAPTDAKVLWIPGDPHPGWLRIDLSSTVEGDRIGLTHFSDPSVLCFNLVHHQPTITLCGPGILLLAHPCERHFCTGWLGPRSKRTPTRELIKNYSCPWRRCISCLATRCPATTDSGRAGAEPEHKTPDPFACLDVAGTTKPLDCLHVGPPSPVDASQSAPCNGSVGAEAE